MRCVRCGCDSAGKVLYAGFPMKFCFDCETLWGFWSCIPLWLGFNGVLLRYRGSYLAALWYFLFHPRE